MDCCIKLLYLSHTKDIKPALSKSCDRSHLCGLQKHLTLGI